MRRCYRKISLLIGKTSAPNGIKIMDKSGTVILGSEVSIENYLHHKGYFIQSVHFEEMEESETISS